MVIQRMLYPPRPRLIPLRALGTILTVSQGSSGLLWALIRILIWTLLILCPAPFPSLRRTLCCSAPRLIQAMELDWQMGVAFHKAGINPFWLPDNLNAVEALHDLFP